MMFNRRSPADEAALRVFEHLDRHDLISAENVVEPWIAKEPQNHLLRAANALLMLHKRETEDAIEAAAALERDEPTDGKAVNACAHVLQQTCQWEAVVRLYQRVIPLLSQGPVPDQSASENLALTFARMHSYGEMQKICSKLAKDTGDVRYTVWATMANLLAAPEGDANSILLKVAARVIDKQILDAPADAIRVTPEHCAMYLEALERQNNFTEAMAFVASKRFRALGPADRLQTYARLALQSGDRVLAAAIGRRLWGMEPENWAFFMMVADGLRSITAADEVAALSVPRTVTFEGEAPIEVVVLKAGEATALDVLHSIEAAQKDPAAPPRGLLLEKMELLHVNAAAAATTGGDKQSAEALQVTVRDFCARNGSRPSCFLDVIKYVPANSDIAWLSAVGGDAAASLDDHRRVTLRLQLAGAIDRSIAESDAASLAHLSAILAALKVCPKPAELGDSAHPWAQLLSAACNAIGRRVFAHKDDAAGRCRWAALGARVVAMAPEKHLLPMIHLFAILFARTLGYHDINAVDALDFKSVQLDSMAFFCLRELRDSHDMVRAFHYASHAHMFYGRFDTDTGNLVAKAFQNAAWTQLRQLREFEKCVTNSVSRAEWFALFAALSTLSSENTSSLIGEARRLRVLVQILRVDPKAAAANDDRSSVAAAAFLEMPGSERQKDLLDSLLPATASPEQRAIEAQGVCAFFLALRDLAIFVTRVTATKPTKADKKASKKGGAPAAEQPLKLLLEDEALGLERRVAAVSCADTAVPIVALIKSIVKGNGLPGKAGKAELAATEAAVEAYAVQCESDNAADLRGILWPQLPLVVSALRLLAPVANKTGAPAKTWAARVSKALHKAEGICAAAAAAPRDFADASLASELGLEPAGDGVVPALHRNTYEKLAHALKAATLELDAVVNLK